MDFFNGSLLLLHIITGYLALMTGLLILFLRKGDKRHKKLGRVFFFSMLGVCVTSIYLALAKDLPFLLYIGIFVLYQCFAGFKSVQNKNLKPDIWDVLILLAALINGIFMLSSLNIVLVVFGGINCLLVLNDSRIYRNIYLNRPLKKSAWLTRHIGMMTGSYIGTLTAFIVVNLSASQSTWILWLMPTLVMLPLMRYWTWKYTGGGRKATDSGWQHRKAEQS